jgi:hypothetical protein
LTAPTKNRQYQLAYPSLFDHEINAVSRQVHRPRIDPALCFGYPLTVSVEKQTLAGKTVYNVAGGLFIICLERELTLDLIRVIADRKPERVVLLDEGFAGNDQLKANLQDQGRHEF